MNTPKTIPAKTSPIRIILLYLIVILGWASIITQTLLIGKYEIVSGTEMVLRLFSRFVTVTVFLNILVFSYMAVKGSKIKGCTLTALTAHVCFASVLYQVILRENFHNNTFQVIVNEVVCSVVPALIFIYWYRYVNKFAANYREVTRWLIYPLIYLGYVLIRGTATGYYPYSFLNISEYGTARVILDCIVLLSACCIFEVLFIFVSRLLSILT